MSAEPTGRTIPPDPARLEPAAPPVTVKIIDRSPLQIKGPIELVDHDGNPLPGTLRRTTLLCRCGLSADKPYCDDSHKHAPASDWETSTGPTVSAIEVITTHEGD